MSAGILIRGKHEHLPDSCTSCVHGRIYEGDVICIATNTKLPKGFDALNKRYEKCPLIVLPACCECTRFRPFADGYGECNRQGATLTVKADDFCSAAERKNENRVN